MPVINRKDVYLAMDVASSEFFDKEKGKYVLAGEGGKELTAKELFTSMKN